MALEVFVKGYDAYCNEIKKHKKNVYAFFCGSTTLNGSSWCPDCVAGRCLHKNRSIFV